MSDDVWGFADIYSMEKDDAVASTKLQDVQSDDWRNILVLGRATSDGVYPETLALIGRARYMADELGCRVEVLLIGEELDAATEVLQKYPINTIYRVHAPTYAPIEKTAKLLEAVVKKRRPELVMAFQSRTGDAVVAYAANRLGVGFVIGASSVDIDTYERRVRATHQATNTEFRIVTEFQDQPQFVTVQRGLFRAPMEDPYASVQAHDLDVDIGAVADVVVKDSNPPPKETLAEAERVVIVGARVRDQADVDAARELASKLGAVFGVSRNVKERGLDAGEEIVGIHDTVVHPRLAVLVGVRGSLELMQAIEGEPAIAAIGSEATDPIAKKATYMVAGPVAEAVLAAFSAL